MANIRPVERRGSGFPEPQERTWRAADFSSQGSAGRWSFIHFGLGLSGNSRPLQAPEAHRQRGELVDYP